MKQNILVRLFQVLLFAVLCVMISACQPVTPAISSVATSQPTLDLTLTATPPQETPEAAPTEIGSWPLSPDQHLMAAQTRDGAWWMWDAALRRPIYLLNDTPVRARPLHNPTFSPDGRYLAAISFGHVLLWEVTNRKRRRLNPPLSMDYRSMRRLVFSPDSHLLANNGCVGPNNHMVCDSGFINLWNTSDGTLARTFAVAFRVSAMTFSPDGSTFTASGCSRTDSLLGSQCYEQSTVVYATENGQLISLTRVPQFR